MRFAAEGFVVFYERIIAVHHPNGGRIRAEAGEYKYSSEDDFGDHMSGIDGDESSSDSSIRSGLFITGARPAYRLAAYAICA